MFLNIITIHESYVICMYHIIITVERTLHLTLIRVEGIVGSPPKHFGDWCSHTSGFIIHLQRDEVELEMNSEPRV